MELANIPNSEKDNTCTSAFLQDQISDVEKSISKVIMLRENLEENAKNVKVDVQTSIGDQLSRMHQREGQLLCQVDALISHQSSLLQMQLSRLYQRLGALRNTLHWVRQGRNIDISQIGEASLTVLPTCHLRYQPTSLSSLETSIREFGHVEANGSSANVLILPEEEDYGDGDHHIFHKALDSDFKIEMHFPKISASSSEWLSRLKMKMETDGQKMEKLQGEEKWVLDSSDGSQESGDFDMVDVSDESESSVELISHPDTQELGAWLQEQTHTKDNKSSCNCIDNGNIEIENLDSLNCIPNKTEPSNKPMSVPEISAVCRSSSKCKTFNDCCCEDNCLVACLKEQMKDLKMQEITKQDCINEVIRATTCMQPKHWLTKDALEITEWLKNNHHNNYSEAKTNCNSKSAKNDAREWLGNGSSEQNVPRTFELPSSLVGLNVLDWIKVEDKSQSSQTCQVNGWLSPTKSVTFGKTVQSDAIREMFVTFFEQHSPGKWIAHDSNNRTHGEWLSNCP